MKTAKQHIIPILELNGEYVKKRYSSEIAVTIVKGTKKEFHSVAQIFELTFKGYTKNNTLYYHLSVKKRILLDQKGRPIFKPSKMEKIGLSIAKINDELNLEVNKHYQIVGIRNSLEIRNQWNRIKKELLINYPDLKNKVDDFDWQLKDENIHTLFLNDNFYSMFFCNLFYKDMETMNHKLISNGIGNLDIPITEQKKLIKQDIMYENIVIGTSAEINTENPRFPLAKINAFLGKLPVHFETKPILNFKYNGTYHIRPRVGIITKGSLHYTFGVKDSYSKETTITFKLEDDE